MEQKWTKEGIIYNVDGTFYWNKSHAQVPVVDILQDGILRIYYATRDHKGLSRTSYIETQAHAPNKVTYIHDLPLLELGPVGSFDDSGIMPTSILNIDATTKYLYYIGWTTRKTVPYSNAIGLAISKDGGKTFKKYASGPIIGVGPKEPFFTGTCNVIKNGKEYVAYYLSCLGWEEIKGKLEPKYDIKIATSLDAINWQIDGKVAIALEEGEGGIASASVLEYQSKYYMWYSVRGNMEYRTNPSQTYRIGFAESDDGYIWRRIDNTLLPLGKDWDSEMLAYPNVVQHSNRLMMFYNGNGFGKSGFGYATSKI